jgi:hypothetical protein
MISSKATRDKLKDVSLKFYCHQFSRGVQAGRPLSRRWVFAEQCLCTGDPAKICDHTRLYRIQFWETPDEEAAKLQKDWADRIGVFFSDGPNNIHVPPHFLDVLWTAAVAADGVLRSIELKVQEHKPVGWAVFEATFKEHQEPFELPVGSMSRPLRAPRDNPTVVELRALREQLRSIESSLRWIETSVLSSVQHQRERDDQGEPAE